MDIRYIWYKFWMKIRGVGINNSTISNDAKIEAGSVFVGSEIKRFSYCGYNCNILNTKIGAFCSISDNVAIGGGVHPIDWVSTSPAFYRGRDSISKRLAKLNYDMKDPQTIIENDVWIGRNVYIKAGVHIGNGVIIGAGSVVTKDIPDYEVWVGNPAKKIRKRFTDEIINELLNSKWWDRDEKILSQCAEYVGNPIVFLNNLDIVDHI